RDAARGPSVPTADDDVEVELLGRQHDATQDLRRVGGVQHVDHELDGGRRTDPGGAAVAELGDGALDALARALGDVRATVDDLGGGRGGHAGVRGDGRQVGARGPGLLRHASPPRPVSLYPGSSKITRADNPPHRVARNGSTPLYSGTTGS